MLPCKREVLVQILLARGRVTDPQLQTCPASPAAVAGGPF